MFKNIFTTQEIHFSFSRIMPLSRSLRKNESDHVLIFWLHCVACGIFVPQSGIKPVLLALGTWSLDHWTAREVLILILKSNFREPCPFSILMWAAWGPTGFVCSSIYLIILPLPPVILWETQFQGLIGTRVCMSVCVFNMWSTLASFWSHLFNLNGHPQF